MSILTPVWFPSRSVKAESLEEVLGQSGCVFLRIWTRVARVHSRNTVPAAKEGPFCAPSLRGFQEEVSQRRVSVKMLPSAKLLLVGGIIIQCLYPQLLASESKPFQIQYCIFIKVSLLFSSSTSLSDLIHRGRPTSGGGGGGVGVTEWGEEGQEDKGSRKKRQGPRWVLERRNARRQNARPRRVVLLLPVSKKERETRNVILLRSRIFSGQSHRKQLFSTENSDLSF